MRTLEETEEIFLKLISGSTVLKEIFPKESEVWTNLNMIEFTIGTCLKVLRGDDLDLLNDEIWKRVKENNSSKVN